MSTDPVDLLRRAATKLRLLTDLEAGTPWEAETTNRGSAWINVRGVPHAWGMHGFPDEARYVEAMHPPVALALADWLDNTADWFSHDDAVRIRCAADLARAVLREPDPTGGA